MDSILTIEEVKKIEIEILDHIDQVLTGNGIPYFLDGGTLLGAVRHNGFIPWDDDIDLIIPRKYYREALEALVKSEGPFHVKSRYTDDEYSYMFAKVIDSRTELDENSLSPDVGLGVYVDLFPLDFLPENETRRKLFMRKMWVLRKIAYNSIFWEYSREKLSRSKKVLSCICNLYGWRKAFKKIEHLCEKSSAAPTNYVADIVSAPKMYMWTKAIDFESAVSIPFEGKKYPAPGGYDSYLRALYGDYMQLPPVEQRVLHHSFTVYRKE